MKRTVLIILAQFLISVVSFGQQITGYVYLDDDQNGILEGLEGGLSQVRVFLYKDNGDGVFNIANDVLTATQRTNIQGIYNFDLRATQTFMPTSSNDDGEEDFDGDMSRGSSDLEMMQEDNLQNAVGIRFRNVTIPQGETISNAFITFRADESDDETTNLLLRGEDIDDSPAFSNDDFDITNRTTTAASRSWSDIPAWEAGTDYTTPSITNIIQEVVNRANWGSGNDLSIIVTGTGKRVAESFNGSEDFAPRLTVKFNNPAAIGTYFIVVNSDDLLPGGTFTEPNVTGIRESTIAIESDSLFFQNIGYAGEAVTCFLIPEDEDRLEIINRVSGDHIIVGNLNSPNNRVEAVSLDLNNNILYAMDEDELGVINLETGAFISRGNTLGDGDGADGITTFDDVDALSYDFNDDVLYGVQAESGRKLIIIDPLTGELVQDAFGAGIDYLEITGTGLLSEISDLTFAPSTGVLYGINTSSSQSQIIQIDKATGTAIVVTNVTFDGDNLEDIEALAFTIYNTDIIYVTTGTEESTENSFFSVDLSTGIATDVTASTPLTGDDYESCDCFFKAIPSLITYEPLPLDLLRFSGSHQDNYHELYWETAREVNFSHFEVYQSRTGKNFEQVGQVAGQNRNSLVVNQYTWESEKAVNRMYYKLKIVDLDGSYEWSRVISVGVDGITQDIQTSLGLVLYPNPAKNHTNVMIENNSILSDGIISVYTMKGERIYHEAINLTTRSTSTINTEKFKNGIYVIRVTTQQQTITQKLLVQH